MDEDVKDLLKFIGYVTGGTLMFFYLITGVVNHMKFGPQVAAFEQLRSDTYVGRVNAEDILGQAAEYNRKLRYMQSWNDKWYADPIIPDGWDELEPIEVAP